MTVAEFIRSSTYGSIQLVVNCGYRVVHIGWLKEDGKVNKEDYKLYKLEKVRFISPTDEGDIEITINLRVKCKCCRIKDGIGYGEK